MPRAIKAQVPFPCAVSSPSVTPPPTGGDAFIPLTLAITRAREETSRTASPGAPGRPFTSYLVASMYEGSRPLSDARCALARSSIRHATHATALRTDKLASSRRASMTSQKRTISQSVKNERRSVRLKVTKTPKLYMCKQDGCGQKFIKQHPHQLYCPKHPHTHSKPLPVAMKDLLQQCAVCPRFFKPLRRNQLYCGPICNNKAWKLRQVINATPLATI